MRCGLACFTGLHPRPPPVLMRSLGEVLIWASVGSSLVTERPVRKTYFKRISCAACPKFSTSLEFIRRLVKAGPTWWTYWGPRGGEQFASGGTHSHAQKGMSDWSKQAANIPSVHAGYAAPEGAAAALWAHLSARACSVGGGSRMAFPLFSRDSHRWTQHLSTPGRASDSGPIALPAYARLFESRFAPRNIFYSLINTFSHRLLINTYLQTPFSRLSTLFFVFPVQLRTPSTEGPTTASLRLLPCESHSQPAIHTETCVDSGHGSSALQCAFILLRSLWFQYGRPRNSRTFTSIQLLSMPSLSLQPLASLSSSLKQKPNSSTVPSLLRLAQCLESAETAHSFIRIGDLEVA